MSQVVILGASGIIGQHMRLCVPAGIEPVWVRRNADALHVGADLDSSQGVFALLAKYPAAVIVNLAGQACTDVVEKDSARYRFINAEMPVLLAQWCALQGAGRRLVHVSSQAVFDGRTPPYTPESGMNPSNLYGEQKMQADAGLASFCAKGIATIVRPTFVVGVRPMPTVGRHNPAEIMMAAEEIRIEVNDRWFSIALARDVAAQIWSVVMNGSDMPVIHCGYGRYSRHDLARELVSDEVAVAAVGHGTFAGFAARPVDTSYDQPARETFADMVKADWRSLQRLGPAQRAKELSLFGMGTQRACLEQLHRGFGELHGEVRDDFNRAAPATDTELLEWYRNTKAYCFELSAYHCDAGFNYAGMCSGVAEKLRAIGAKKVLCLGDGIGDLTLSLCRAGFDAIYHDLAGSVTARFADHRFYMYLGSQKRPGMLMSTGWDFPEMIDRDLAIGVYPAVSNSFDAVVSLDFLEHVTDVPHWVTNVHRVLKPGGLFFTQNAFGAGSGPQGSIPMHLERNDCYVSDWDPLLNTIGFVQESSNAYRKQPWPEAVS